MSSKCLVTALLSLSLSGCSIFWPEQVETDDLEKLKRFHITTVTPFTEQTKLANQGVADCSGLGEQVSLWVKDYGRQHDLNIIRQASIDKMADGNHVIIELDKATLSEPYDFSQDESLAIKARLYVDGHLVDSYSARRDSNGGFWGHFKSSCSLLEHNAQALGGDIANWLSLH